jgi:predicted patatin/cPLA2 family phospholipase
MALLNHSRSFKTYKDIALIPSGQSNSQITDGCLVLEGGAWRGLYTEGVTDYLLENNLNFHTVIGVSAGALSGIYYMCGQIGNAARVNLGYRKDRDYVGVRPMIRDQGITGFSFLFDEMARYYPLDTERLCDPRRHFYTVVTNCLTGKPEYKTSHDADDIAFYARTSATVPYVSRPVIIGNTPYLDGGISDCVPFRWAEENGYKKIIVVRTRHREFRDTPREHTKIDERLYRNYPELLKDLLTSPERYNSMLDELDRQEKEGRVFVIAPKEPVSVRRFETDLDKLGELYWQGYHDMQAQLPGLRQYLHG